MHSMPAPSTRGAELLMHVGTSHAGKHARQYAWVSLAVVLGLESAELRSHLPAKSHASTAHLTHTASR